MEKYAVDLSLIPPTDEQLRVIKKLAGEEYDQYIVKTASQAEEVIQELESNN